MRRLVLLLISVANAQVSDTIHVDVRVVSVTASVSDRSGTPLTHLKRDDFTILDNKKPREAQSFWQESDVPLTIGLIADVSGSQIDMIKQHRQTIAQFLSQVMGPRDRAFIVTIGPYVKLVTDLTNSMDELRAGIDRIDFKQLDGTPLGDQCPPRRWVGKTVNPGCSTALWNGVYSSARLKMKPLTGRKALLVLSDGLDNSKPHTLTDAIEAAQSADTLVYSLRSISVPHRNRPGPDVGGAVITAVTTALSKGLQRLSEETGGRARDLPSDPSGAFGRMEAELRSLYVLGFTVPPEDRDEKFHPLEVKTNIPGAVVRARKGYIAQPDASTRER
jgi:VWFA-related protein